MEKLPTKQKAIQEQIDLIMDEFDFKSCIRLLDRIKEDGHPYPKHWHDEDFGWSESAIRKDARRALRSVANILQANDDGFCKSSYFAAIGVIGRPKEAPIWVQINLFFGIDSINDGTDFSDE
jgi:hypothetical protein